MSADLHAFLRSRRSIRRFKPDPVPAPLLERILTTAAHAPSAHNTQPWRFVVIDKNPPAQSADRLAHALTSAMRRDMAAAGASVAEIETRLERSLKRIREAPIIVLLCRDLTAVREQRREDEVMAIQSVANAATYLLLAAHAEGLGGNWICWPLYAQAETRAALSLPETWLPEALFFLGWPDEMPGEKVVKPLEEIVFHIENS